MDLLQLTPGARIIATGQDRIYWFTEQRQGVLSLPAAGTLVKALQGEPCTRDRLLTQHPPDALRSASGTLDELIALGLVESAILPPRLTELLQSLHVGPQIVKRKSWTEGARVLAFDEDDGRALVRSLSGVGVNLVSQGGFPVVVARDYTDARIGPLSRSFEAEGVSWTMVRISGEEVWLGPVFEPGAACWKCLEMRLAERWWLRTQLPMALEFAEAENFPERLAAGAEFAAAQIARRLLGVESSPPGEIWSFSWTSLQASRHPMIRFRHCTQCGAPFRPERGGKAPELNSVRVPAASGSRSLSSSALNERLSSLMSPVTGIAAEFAACDTNGNSAVHIWSALQNPPIPPPHMRVPGTIVQSEVCSGRGWTREDAMAACAAEAVERYSVSFRGDEARFPASYQALGESAIHPNAVQLFSDLQFEERALRNRRPEVDELIPEPFDGSRTIEWMRGWSLTSGSERFLPAALCLNYYRPPDSPWIGSAGTNGCAAGATREEAILHGLLELIERDALAIWWYNGLGFLPIQVTGERGDRSLLAIEGLIRSGWEVRIGDLTTDLGIPVAIAVGVDSGGSWVFGLGAGLEIGEAVRGAVSELSQMSLARRRPGPAPLAMRQNPVSVELCRPTVGETDLKEAIERCCARVAAAGSDVIAFDLTRPEIPLRVVRIVAPGLRPKEPRFAPGRLYDVPVRMNCLAAARNERDLRPNSP